MSTIAARQGQEEAYDQGLSLLRLGRHIEAIECFERALIGRPNDASILFALGNTADAIGHAAAAEKFFRRVLEEKPDRLEALVNLANLLRRSGRTAETIALLKPAIERNPQQAELWLTLGSAVREAGDPKTAETFYREALRLMPDCAPAMGNLADLLADKGNVEEAITLYQSALTSDPENAQARLNRAFLFLMTGDLEQGWRDYEYRLKIKERVIHSNHGLPAWQGELKTGARLLITAEQGLGDQIMFASLIPEIVKSLSATQGSILLEAEPRLVPLFARSFPGIAVHGAKMESRGGQKYAYHDWLKERGGADAAIALGSLPCLLRRKLSDFPNGHVYLIPDAKEKKKWSRWFGAQPPGPTIGVCWRSGQTAGLRGIQYAPLELWADFIRSCPGTPVSLQYDVRTEELDALQRLSGRRLVLPPKLDQKQEIDRSAAMIASLDAVASAPTSVSWIAAALGVPTFKLLYNNSWTSFGTDYEPFAPTCRCMMPTRCGDWRETFAQAAEALNRRLLPDGKPAP